MAYVFFLNLKIKIEAILVRLPLWQIIMSVTYQTDKENGYNDEYIFKIIYSLQHKSIFILLHIILSKSYINNLSLSNHF